MTQEALKLALTALEINLTLLEKITPYKGQEDFLSDAIAITQNTTTFIKEALAQPEQEPDGIALTSIPHPQGVSAPDDLNADALEVVELELPDECEAVGWADDGVINWIAGKQFKHASFLYPNQQQRTWVGLTDEEISELIRATHNTGSFVCAIEAKLKEKNT